MMKILSSSIALALGAGAIYYWWQHEHGGDLESALHHTQDDLHDIGGELRKAAEDV